jgi:thiamine pyrophosphate-dependent acetolactate synthase large subunit-like protein
VDAVSAPLDKATAIRAIIEATSEQPIIFSTGYACRFACGIADRENHFYMTGSMGLASSIAIGVALETGHTTVVVDGDGSLVMNPVGLVIAGGLQHLPLVHIVLDDGRYASTGGQAVPAENADLCALARASGYRWVSSTDRLDRFTDTVRGALTDRTSPAFIHAALTGEEPAVHGRVDGALSERARRFKATLAESPVRSG